jgi:hypothetical protein
VDDRQNQERQKQPIFEPAKVIAIGIASPAAALLTSRFGVAGTLVGLALSAMILTAVADFLKVYLARTSQVAAHVATAKVSGVTKAPRGLLARLFGRKGHPRQKAPHRGFSRGGSSLPPTRQRRRRFLLAGRSVVAAGISFVLALGLVTALELGAGKSLSCWAWEECAAESSSGEEGSENPDETSSTLGSVFGGVPTASSDASGDQPAAGPPQQRSAPSRSPEPGSSRPPSEAAGDRWWDQTEEQQQQQQDSYYYSSSEGYEQQSPSPITTGEGQQREDPNGGSSNRENQKTGEPENPSVPWTT